MTLESLRPGVTCEHCHAGTTTHLADSLNGDFDSAPPGPPQVVVGRYLKFLRPVSSLLGNGGTESLARPTDRSFQPYRLANSKCFDGADPRISCIACHDPHHGCRPPGLLLRCQLPGVPLELPPSVLRIPLNPASTAISNPCENLPNCQIGVRELSYAQGKVAQRTPGLYRSPDSDSETGRAISQLSGKWKIGGREYRFRHCAHGTDVEWPASEVRGDPGSAPPAG